MIELERSLVELAERLEIPGEERLVGAVLGRVRQPVPRPVLRTTVRWAVAVMIVLGVAAAVLPGPRRAVARWLGFDSVRIEPNVTLLTTTTPTTPASDVTTATVATSTTVATPPFDLGPAVSIEEAMSSTGLPDPTPAQLGSPQSIHVVKPPEVGQIVEVYGPSELLPESDVTGVGALVSVFPGVISEGLFGKVLGPDATVQSVDVAGSPGYWIEGAPHEVFFELNGQTERDTMRLATNTLLWQRDGRVYRVEADVSLETALRIAVSIG
jgi:hypothetical protein